MKGRRHRLNYKKMYNPDLYIEPSKQQKKEIEKRKKVFQARREGVGPEGGVGMVRAGGVKRGGMTVGRGGGQLDVNELRRQESAELAKMYVREVCPSSIPVIIPVYEMEL